jgi:hypothetical protein
VRVFNLFDYISSRVKQDSAGAQTPIFKATELDENFAIALVAGGKTKSINLRNLVTDDKDWVWTRRVVCGTTHSEERRWRQAYYRW